MVHTQEAGDSPSGNTLPEFQLLSDSQSSQADSDGVTGTQAVTHLEVKQLLLASVLYFLHHVRAREKLTNTATL